ncbi:MAG TPA: hypothetical protein VGA78_02670 [Gemmatimonadales bacterium]
MRTAITTIGIAVALGGVLPAVSAQPVTPGRRAHHALVYDEARQLILLTAGSTPVNGGQSFTFFNDLWAFDGSGWRPLGESGERLSGIRLAYDAPRHRVTSFGGYNGRSMGELRALEGEQWRILGRLAEMLVAEPGFVFDLGRNRFVAFGGSSGPGRPAGDTWEYDGTSWTRLAPAGPPPRQAHVMVFDERRGRTLVFGGMGAGASGQPPPSLDDTWEFDGRTWVRREVSGPSARHSAGVAYDSKRGLVILFGGSAMTDSWATPGLGTGPSGPGSPRLGPSRAVWATWHTTNGATGWSCSGAAKGIPMGT